MKTRPKVIYRKERDKVLFKFTHWGTHIPFVEATLRGWQDIVEACQAVNVKLISL
jgi:hypothetical protein